MRAVWWSLLGFLTACGGGTRTHPRDLIVPVVQCAPDPVVIAAPAFATAKATRGSVTGTILATGQLAPITVANVGNLYAGHILQVNAQANDPVRKGQVLAKLDTRKEVIVAPFDGIVLERRVEVGQVATPGAILFRIASPLDRLVIEAPIPQADVTRLASVASAELTVDGLPRQRLAGTIRRVSNVATPGVNGVTYRAVIDVDNAELKLRPGMTARIAIKTDSHEDALLVPSGALAFRAGHDGRPTVWVVRDATVTPIAVQLGLSDGSVTEILGGDVHAGDALAIIPLDPPHRP